MWRIKPVDADPISAEDLEGLPQQSDRIALAAHERADWNLGIWLTEEPGDEPRLSFVDLGSQPPRDGSCLPGAAHQRDSS